LVGCRSVCGRRLSLRPIGCIRPLSVIWTAPLQLRYAVPSPYLLTYSDALNSAALELIQLLMQYDVRGALLEGLVRLLRPTAVDIDQQLDILTGQ